LNGINLIFQSVLNEASEGEFGTACLAVVEELTGSTISFIGEIGADGFLHDIAVSNPTWDVCTIYDQQGQRRRPPASFHIHGIYGSVLSNGTTLLTNDPASHPARVGLPSGHPSLTAFLGVPLKEGNKTVGMIAVANRKGGYGGAEQATLEALAPVIQEALARRKAEKALREGQDLLEEKVKERTLALEALTEQLQELSVQLLVAERNERKRVARILHDQLQQMMVGAKIQLESLSQSLEEDKRHRLERSIQMITDSLKMSRTLTEELAPQALEYTNVAKLLEWVCAFTEKTHNLKVDLVRNDDVEVQDRVVRSFVCQCVQELLLNAVKHSETDTARVRLSKDSNGNLKITVSDSGRGFDPDLLKKELHRGNHFGLFSIQQRLMSLKGSMTWESVPGNGAKFTITLPLTEEQELSEDQAEKLSSKKPSSEIKLEGRNEIKVLVVDDHKIVREGLVQLLEEAPEIKVMGEAKNGVEAVGLALRLVPDIILMDINMPDIDGIEATRAIHSKLPDVRIIGLSIDESRKTVDEMLSAGASDFLSKESSSKTVVETIRKQFQLSGHEKGFGRPYGYQKNRRSRESK
jgi:signal transduction histidine kinase/ActR/RegA family two-component response regulator